MTDAERSISEFCRQWARMLDGDRVVAKRTSFTASGARGSRPVFTGYEFDVNGAICQIASTLIIIRQGQERHVLRLTEHSIDERCSTLSDAAVALYKACRARCVRIGKEKRDATIAEFANMAEQHLCSAYHRTEGEQTK